LRRRTTQPLCSSSVSSAPRPRACFERRLVGNPPNRLDIWRGSRSSSLTRSGVMNASLIFAHLWRREEKLRTRFCRAAPLPRTIELKHAARAIASGCLDNS
jgi:hypothetical protein